jgi:hypothetical protein
MVRAILQVIPPNPLKVRSLSESQSALGCVPKRAVNVLQCLSLCWGPGTGILRPARYDVLSGASRDGRCYWSVPTKNMVKGVMPQVSSGPGLGCSSNSCHPLREVSKSKLYPSVAVAPWIQREPERSERRLTPISCISSH